MKAKAQTEKEERLEALDYSSSQLAGFTGIGLGGTVIAYTASAKNDPPKYPAAYYIAGSALVITGVCFLIWGNKDKEDPKYWKGMGSSSLQNRKRYISFSASRQ